MQWGSFAGGVAKGWDEGEKLAIQKQDAELRKQRDKRQADNDSITNERAKMDLEAAKREERDRQNAERALQGLPPMDVAGAADGKASAVGLPPAMPKGDVQAIDAAQAGGPGLPQNTVGEVPDEPRSAQPVSADGLQRLGVAPATPAPATGGAPTSAEGLAAVAPSTPSAVGSGAPPVVASSQPTSAAGLQRKPDPATILQRTVDTNFALMESAQKGGDTKRYFEAVPRWIAARTAQRLHVRDAVLTNYKVTGDPNAVVPYYNDFIGDGTKIDGPITKNADGTYSASFSANGQKGTRNVTQDQLDGMLKWILDPTNAAKVDAQFAVKKAEAANKVHDAGPGHILVRGDGNVLANNPAAGRFGTYTRPGEHGGQGVYNTQTGEIPGGAQEAPAAPPLNPEKHAALMANTRKIITATFGKKKADPVSGQEQISTLGLESKINSAAGWADVIASSPEGRHLGADTLANIAMDGQTTDKDGKPLIGVSQEGGKLYMVPVLQHRGKSYTGTPIRPLTDEEAKQWQAAQAGGSKSPEPSKPAPSTAASPARPSSPPAVPQRAPIAPAAPSTTAAAAGAGLRDSQTIKLSQIIARGQRVTDPVTKTLIRMAAASGKLTPQEIAAAHRVVD